MKRMLRFSKQCTAVKFGFLLSENAVKTAVMMQIQCVSKVTSLGTSYFLTDEREYCETFEIHQK